MPGHVSRVGGVREGTLWWFFVAMLGVTSVLAQGASAQFVDGDPKTPEEIVDYFVRAGVQATDAGPVRRRLQREAEACAPIIAAHLALPEKLSEWKMDEVPAVGQPFSRALNAVFTQRLLQELGAEHADPILKKFYTGSRKLLEQAGEGLEALAAGEPGEDHEEQMARFLRAQEFFSSLMTRAIRVAIDLHSPVLVEPILEFYEAGLEHRYTHWADYALIHSAQRPDVIPRLRTVMEDRRTPEAMRQEIDRALERYQASLVDAGGGGERSVREIAGAGGVKGVGGKGYAVRCGSMFCNRMM